MEWNFDKYDNSFVDTQNSSYDYAWVMRDERYVCTSNGLPAIVYTYSTKCWNWATL